MFFQKYIKQTEGYVAKCGNDLHEAYISAGAVNLFYTLYTNGKLSIALVFAKFTCQKSLQLIKYCSNVLQNKK